MGLFKKKPHKTTDQELEKALNEAVSSLQADGKTVTVCWKPGHSFGKAAASVQEIGNEMEASMSDGTGYGTIGRWCILFRNLYACFWRWIRVRKPDYEMYCNSGLKKELEALEKRMEVYEGVIHQFGLNGTINEDKAFACYKAVQFSFPFYYYSLDTIPEDCLDKATFGNPVSRLSRLAEGPIPMPFAVPKEMEQS